MAPERVPAESPATIGPDDAARLMECLFGFVHTQALNTAIDLGIPDVLADGARSAADIAATCATDVSATGRLLRCLVSAGALAETEPGVLALTSWGRCLQSGVAGGSKEYVQYICRYTTTAAAYLTDLVVSGRSGEPFEKANGKPFFQFMAEDPVAGASFDAAMASSLSGLRDGVVAWRWDTVSTVVDVGGGNGTLIVELLRRSDHLTATLCEQEHVLPAAARVLAAAGLTERCALQPGDFFRAVPAGGDVYVLARILHDWDDRQAARILANVRAAMAPHARLLIAEHVLSGGPGPHWSKAYDLFMTMLLPGHERDRRQWTALLESAGFGIEQISAAGWRSSVLECRPR
ncbi:MAG: methyltransferase [Pseudonocardiaceae bacterium]